jgi:hypothetical protein
LRLLLVVEILLRHRLYNSAREFAGKTRETKWAVKSAGMMRENE